MTTRADVWMRFITGELFATMADVDPDTRPVETPAEPCMDASLVSDDE
jgi:hypothetical protein